MAPVTISFRCSECGAKWDDIGGDTYVHECPEEAVVLTFLPWGSDTHFSSWDEALAYLEEEED